MTQEESLALLNNSELLFDEQTCRTALQHMAQEIRQTLSDKYPLILPVMGGAVVFTGQLLPLLDFPLEFDYIHVSRYNNQLKGDTTLQWLRAPQNSVTGRHVLILDDILDEGHTMSAIHQQVMSMGALSCRCAVFANKLIPQDKPIQADFVGLDVPNRYVFGYGMDAKGAWRNLPAIYALKDK